jgi:chromosomal replication initiation ATPase DnaA
MSEQLALNLDKTIRFLAANFLLHSGITKLCSDLETILTRRTFSLAYVVGAKRSGKTHLAAYLEHRMQSAGKAARTAPGRDLLEWYREKLSARPLCPGEVVIIDDADDFLTRSHDDGTAGVFVDIVERARSVKGAVVLLGAEEPESLKVGAQAKSHLVAGLYLRIGNPVEAELDALLDAITKQRGILLTDAKRSYVLKRVPRDIGGLVDCIERVREPGDGSFSTSFHVLAGAVLLPPE